jgi:hypothetical protein
MSDPNLVTIYSPEGEAFEVTRLNARDLTTHAGWTEVPVQKAAPAAAETPVETPVETPAPKRGRRAAQQVETPAEETPAEETPAEETPAEETPAEETPAEETPAEETPAE